MKLAILYEGAQHDDPDWEDWEDYPVFPTQSGSLDVPTANLILDSAQRQIGRLIMIYNDINQEPYWSRQIYQKYSETIKQVTRRPSINVEHEYEAHNEIKIFLDTIKFQVESFTQYHTRGFSPGAKYLIKRIVWNCNEYNQITQEDLDEIAYQLGKIRNINQVQQDLSQKQISFPSKKELTHLSKLEFDHFVRLWKENAVSNRPVGSCYNPNIQTLIEIVRNPKIRSLHPSYIKIISGSPMVGSWFKDPKRTPRRDKIKAIARAWFYDDELDMKVATFIGKLSYYKRIPFIYLYHQAWNQAGAQVRHNWRARNKLAREIFWRKASQFKLGKKSEVLIDTIKGKYHTERFDIRNRHRVAKYYLHARRIPKPWHNSLVSLMVSNTDVVDLVAKIKTKTLSRAVKFFSDQEDMLIPLTLKAVNVFQDYFQQWLHKIKKVNPEISKHDAYYWLPDTKSPGLGHYLFKYFQHDLNHLRFASAQWKSLSDDQKKLNPKKLYTTLMGDELDQFKKFATAAGYDRESAVQVQLDWKRSITPSWMVHFKKKWKHKGLVGEFLEKRDARGVWLGIITDCCQYLGGAGGSCAEYGHKQTNSGFFIVSKGGVIIAQS